MGNLYQGAVADETYSLDIVPGDSGLDLSTVTAAELHVIKPGGPGPVTWTAARSNQTPTTLTLTHTFSVAPSELDVSGDYVIYAVLTVPGGTRTTERVRRRVYPTYGVP